MRGLSSRLRFFNCNQNKSNPISGLEETKDIQVATKGIFTAGDFNKGLPNLLLDYCKIKVKCHYES